MFKNAQPYEVRTIRSDWKLREIIWHIECNQNTGFARACAAIGGKCWLCLLGKGFDAVCLNRKYLSHKYTLSAVRLVHRIYCWENEHSAFLVQRPEQQHIIGINHDVIHLCTVLPP